MGGEGGMAGWKLVESRGTRVGTTALAWRGAA